MSKERFTEEQKNTVTARHWNEVLTNNAILNHYSQCKDCFFRDKTTVNGEEFGYDKCYCHIYGLQTVLRFREDKAVARFAPKYDPVEDEDKPNEVYENTAECEYYEEE